MDFDQTLVEIVRLSHTLTKKLFDTQADLFEDRRRSQKLREVEKIMGDLADLVERSTF